MIEFVCWNFASNPVSQKSYTVIRNLLYALTNYRVRNTAADGTSKVFERKAEDVFWGEPITHKGENVGDTEVRALIVELKQR
jgi:hypothetical protein